MHRTAPLPDQTEAEVSRDAETPAERWRAENAEAIASSNDYVERNGLPLAGFRPW